jgi:hypothetical protein
MRITRRIIQIIPAVPGQFAWYWWGSDENGNGKEYPSPVVAWALCDVTYGNEDEDELPERDTFPLIHALEYNELCIAQDIEDDFAESLGLWPVTEVTTKFLQEKLPRAREAAAVRKEGRTAEARLESAAMRKAEGAREGTP